MNKKLRRCLRCGHEWATSSRMWKVTCPSCFMKVDNKERIREVETNGTNYGVYNGELQNNSGTSEMDATSEGEEC